MMAIHNSHVGSKWRVRWARTGEDSASTVTSVAKSVAPLLDHLGNALVNLLVGRMEGLHFGHRLLALRDRHFGPHRRGEVLDVDLRGLDRVEVLYEKPRRVGMLGALQDGRRRDDQDGA